jgi:hypothetical protein
MNQPYDVYGKLEDPTGVLSVNLAIWETRDDSIPQPEVRTAANKAMDAIDGMLRDLYLMRSRLIDEIRESDDATDKRTEELLARCRS